MSPWWAMLAFGGATGIAVVLLWLFHPRSWYWHCASLVLAFILAFLPYPQMSLTGGPAADLVVGSAIVLLLVWGLGGLLTLGAEHAAHQKHA